MSADVHERVFQLLSGSNTPAQLTLRDLLGDHVYPLRAPRFDRPAPVLIYTRVGDADLDVFCGDSGGAFQIEVYAPADGGLKPALEIMEAALAVLEPITMSTSGPQDLVDDETGMLGQRIEIDVAT